MAGENQVGFGTGAQTETSDVPNQIPVPDSSGTGQMPPSVGAPAAAPQGPPQQAGQPPVQAVAAHPKATLFHSILNVLGGGDKEQYSIDPQTGTMSTSRVPQTSGALSKSIIAGALTGLFAGAGEHGPGATGRAFQSGGQAVQQQRQMQDAQQKMEAQQNYERQQKQIVSKAQIFAANSRAMLNMSQAAKLGQETAEKYVTDFDPIYESAQQDGRVTQDNITEQDALAAIKDGKINAGDHQFIPRKAVPNEKGGIDYVGAIMEDGRFDPKSDPEGWASAQKNGFIPKGISADGANLKVSTWNQIKQKNAMVSTAQAEMKLVHDKLGAVAEAMPSFDEAIQTPGMANALSKFQSYLQGAKGFDPVAAINQMSKEVPDKKNPGQMIQNPDSRYVPLIYKAFGGQDILYEYQQKATGKAPEMDIKQAVALRAKRDAGQEVDPDELKMADSVYQQNIGLAGAKAGATEQAKQDVATKTEEEQEKFLTTPSDWDMDAALKTKQMDQFEAEKYLKSKGWTIPKNFAELYAIGTGDVDPKTDPQKGYRGTGIVTAQSAATFIRKAINPNFSSSDWLNRKQIEQEYSSKKANTAGGTIYAAGVAARHLQSLEKAAGALANGNIQAFNAAANEVEVQTGQPAPMVFAAMANKVNSEVEKVVSGGAPLEAQLKEMGKTLPTKASMKQVRGVTKGYLNLMAGRMSELDSAYVQATGKHVSIPDEAKAIYKDHGEGVNEGWMLAKPSGHLPTDRIINPTKQDQQNQPIFANSPGKPRLMSTDGGKTWQTAPAQQ